MCSPGCSGLKPPGAHVAVAQGEDALAKLPPLAGVPVRLNHPGKYPHSATRFLPPRAAVNGVGEEAGAGGEGLARCGSPRCTRPRSRRLCRCPWRSGTGAPSRSPRLSESRLLAMLSTQGLWRVRAAYLRYGAAGKGVAVVLPPYLRRRVAPEFVLRAAKAVVRQQQQAPRRLVVHVPAPLEVHRPGEYLPSVLLFHAVFVDGLPHAPRPPPTGPARPRGTARPPSAGHTRPARCHSRCRGGCTCRPSAGGSSHRARCPARALCPASAVCAPPPGARSPRGVCRGRPSAPHSRPGLSPARRARRAQSPAPAAVPSM